MFAAVLANNIEKAPRKLSPFHQYFKLYWKTRIKDEYLRRYAIARKEYDDATEDDKTSGIVKKPVPVQVRTEVGKTFWLLESDEFRAEVAQEAEDAHAKAMQEWEEVKQAPTTPVQFHQYVASITFDPIAYRWQSYRQLAFAGQYLRPVADAIAAQMQAAVSICIIGPVSSGEVEVRRYITLIYNASAGSLINKLSVYMLIGRVGRQVQHGPCTILRDIVRPKNPCAVTEELTLVSISLMSVHALNK